MLLRQGRRQGRLLRRRRVGVQRGARIDGREAAYGLAALRKDADNLVDRAAAQQEVKARGCVPIAQDVTEGGLRHREDLARWVDGLEAHLHREATATTEGVRFQFHPCRAVWCEDPKHLPCAHVEKKQQRGVAQLLRSVQGEPREDV